MGDYKRKLTARISQSTKCCAWLGLDRVWGELGLQRVTIRDNGHKDARQLLSQHQLQLQLHILLLFLHSRFIPRSLHDVDYRCADLGSPCVSLPVLSSVSDTHSMVPAAAACLDYKQSSTRQGRDWSPTTMKIRQTLLCRITRGKHIIISPVPFTC